MKILFDTHSFIWWGSEPERLSLSAKQLLADSEHEYFLSVISIWEILIKQMSEKLSLRVPLPEILRLCDRAGLQILSVELPHVLALESLPNPHRDPFDRLLIAQAVAEDLTVLTADKVFSEYPIKTIW